MMERKSILITRFSQGLSCVFVFFAVGYFVFWCLDPTNLPVSSVKCIGDTKYVSEAELRNALYLELDTGFVRLKVSSLQQQLLSLPWIKQADVRKVWPNQLVVRFEEHVPAAFWGDKGVLSERGTLFYPDRAKLTSLSLPLLQGPEGKSQLVWQQFLVMKQTLAPIKLNITNLSLAPRGAWHLSLSNGMTVVLGTNDTLTRLDHFVRAYEKYLHLRQQNIAYVDLRYTNGMAIGWRAG